MTDNPMLEIFQKELAAQNTLLNEYLVALESQQEVSAFYAKLAASARAIKGGAKILGLDALMPLGKALEEFFDHAQTVSTAPAEEQRQTLKQIKALIEECAQCDLDALGPHVQDKAGALQQLAVQLKPGTAPKPPVEPVKPPVTPEAGIAFDAKLLDLFRIELETQTKLLNAGLVDIEQTGPESDTLEALMRAAHSIKGAARVVNLVPIVQLAHAIEDCFVAAQHKQITLGADHIDVILKGVDLFFRLAKVPPDQLSAWIDKEKSGMQEIATWLAAPAETPEPKPPAKAEPLAPVAAVAKTEKSSLTQERVLRITAQNLSRLMGLAGESLVESRWLQPFSQSLLKVKKSLNDLSLTMDQFREYLEEKSVNERLNRYLIEVQHKAGEATHYLADCMVDLELFILRHSSLSDRLYREVINSRMRPFADGVEGFPRMVRDLARQLNKKVHLEILGKATPVDRDILEKLEAPLSHLLRNAVDHGIESPEDRIKSGKSPEGTIRMEAQHRAGMLAISITDDGHGVDMPALRQRVLDRGLVTQAMADSLTEGEWLDFLFLPGFSTATHVTEISGRGVGLNVVQSMVQEVSGTVRVSSKAGSGMTFNLLLPLTLSVIRALIVEISGEPYAFPLARIDRALVVPNEQIEIIENRQYFTFEGQNIGIVPAAQVLELAELKMTAPQLHIIVISDHMNCYGIVVDKFAGEKERVVHELDPRLGKVADINAGALMEDGSPVLIVDVEDMVRSIDQILTGGRLHKLIYVQEKAGRQRKRRILVVDDSITVREVECRLLQNQGYEVQSAVNGIDGWNALRMGAYDLVVTDVDMPRMNGIELVRMIRSDAKLHDLPVLIVSYKEREEDRLLGLEAGANYYLTKSSFHDETLIKAVTDLIGPAQG